MIELSEVLYKRHVIIQSPEYIDVGSYEVCDTLAIKMLT